MRYVDDCLGIVTQCHGVHIQYKYPSTTQKGLRNHVDKMTYFVDFRILLATLVLI